MRKNMDQIVALCKRRGFIFQSSEIYGGIGGFWDYGPLGVELKRNVREAWWRDMITYHDELTAPEGAPQSFSMVGVETSIIMHPQVWKCVGHYDLFHDMMVDCKECKSRFRADHIRVKYSYVEGNSPSGEETVPLLAASYVLGGQDTDWGNSMEKRLRAKSRKLADEKNLIAVTDPNILPDCSLTEYIEDMRDRIGSDELPPNLHPRCPKSGCDGALTEPREFNLMFETHTGAMKDESNKVFLRPETAQGMFVNFKNVVDSSRVKIPFGIAQIGKSFRNEITPRNFTFRSREFEQMEMEFFCHPDESKQWYQYWRDRRFQWYQDLGITGDNLILRDHEAEELAHYSVGTADVEYAFPFLEEGEYGELEGVAHRGDFDLRSHMEGKLIDKGDGCLELETDAEGNPKYKGSGKDLTYFNDQTRERFLPHVIEPAAGADRATLAFLCEAYHEDEQPDEKGNMKSRVYLKLHPRLAPVKVAVFPLIKKLGMPEKAGDIYRQFKKEGIACFYDQQGAIGRRYRRQDEIGTPFCLTVDGDTETDNCVTLRDRDTLQQDRVPVEEVVSRVKERIAV